VCHIYGARAEEKNLKLPSERHRGAVLHVALTGLRLGMDSKLQTFRTYGALVRNYTNAKHI
jgi:hypothetical protein